MKTKKTFFRGLFAIALLVAATVGALESNKSEVALNELAMANVEALANGENDNGKGTLYGNESGTQFCCCPGSNSCAASGCASAICK